MWVFGLLSITKVKLFVCENDPKYSRKICISTNSSCNLKCIYCYERDKKNLEFDENEAIGIITDILKTTTKDGTKIKLHGGEPFLVFQKIKRLCENLWKQDFPEYYHVHITTNGTLVHGEIQDWLYKNRDKITIKLSLDGNKRTNDINRPNSFDFIDIPFFLKAWPNLRVNMTITPETVPYIYENIKYMNSVGIKRIISHFSLMTDWENCHMEKKLYKQLLDVTNFYLDNPELEPWFFFSYDISRTLSKSRCFSPCALGETKAYDFQTKAFYPCHMCFPSLGGEKISMELGKIDFSRLNEYEETCCAECPFINICITCYAENYISRGSVSRRDMSMCFYNKLIYAALAKYEYARIIKLENPSPEDIKKMMAIDALQDEIKSIEDKIANL